MNSFTRSKPTTAVVAAAEVIFVVSVGIGCGARVAVAVKAVTEKGKRQKRRAM